MAKIKIPKTKPKGALPDTSTRIGDIEYDPRFDPRVKEQERIKNTEVVIEPTSNVEPPTVSLVDYEGYPFVTSMSDRTRAGGVLTNIEGVELNRPVELPGGQDYMFNNPGKVWSSGAHPVRQIMAQAAALKEATGRDPLYMPWRMAPTGGDFASMAGETMLNYAEANMGKRAKQRLDKQIKTFIPDWAGVDSDKSIEQFRSAPDTVRKTIKQMMDVDFREEGGLNIGQARLATADPRQYNAPDSHIMNVGRIFADKPMVMDSGHVWYPRGVPGEGIGIIDQPRSIFELLPDYAKERGIPDPSNPRQTDIRSMQMKPYGGIISEELLRKLGYREGGMVDQALVDKVNAPAAKAMLEMDLARLAVAKDKMQPKKMAKGGIGKVKAPKVNAPAVVPRSTLTELQNFVREREGGYGAARLERAADEIKNLETLYSQEALRRAFTGDNASALMTMNPADFEKYAAPIPPMAKADPSSGVINKYSVTTDDYIKYLAETYRKGGFDDVPFLEINKEEQGLPLAPFISGHEGRHRNRAMAGAGEEAGLVQLLPRAELREPFPRRYREDYIEALKKELEMTGNKVLPQTWREADPNSFNDKVIRRPEIDLPDIYAKGGKVKLPKNVLPAADRAANFERYMQDAAIRDRLFHATTATEGMKGEEALSSLKLSREGALGSGIYMHPDPEHVGKWYAEGEGGNILPLHTNMKNPLYITGEHADPMKEALIKLGVDPAKADSIVERAYEQKGYIGKEVQSRAQEAGYDGLVQMRDGEIGEVVSYNPMNVKSATGNTGEYKNWSGLLGNKNGGMVSFPSVEEMRIEMMERKNAKN